VHTEIVVSRQKLHNAVTVQLALNHGQTKEEHVVPAQIAGTGSTVWLHPNLIGRRREVNDQQVT
jgi:hypothetical protein